MNVRSAKALGGRRVPWPPPGAATRVPDWAAPSPSSLGSLAFDRIGCPAAILDRSGTIEATNDSWQRSAHLHDGATGVTAVGSSYLEVCDRAAAAGDVVSGRAAEGLRQVLDGDRQHFDLEYRCPSIGPDTWLRLQVSRADSETIHVVVFHTDISAEKRLRSVVAGERATVPGAVPPRRRPWWAGRQRHLGSDGPGTGPESAHGLAAHHRAVLDALGEGVVVQDLVGRLVYANQRALDLLPKGMNGIGGSADGSVVVDERGDALAPRQQPTYLALEAAQAIENAVIGIMARDGSIRWLELSAQPMTAPGELKPYAVVSVVRDITSRREGDDLLALKARLLDSVGQAVIAWDTSGRVTFANTKAEELYGLDRNAAIGRSITEVIDIEDDVAGARFEGLIESVTIGRPWEGELNIARADRRAIPVWTANTPVIEDGLLIGHIGVSRDLSDQKRADARLAHRFRHDVLTDLPTRSTFVEVLAERVAFLDHEDPHELQTVVLVDIGSLDLLNDAFTYATGDAAILHCAALLRRAAHPGDEVARFSDRAFAISCSHLDALDAATAYAEEIRQAMSEPFDVGGVAVHLRVAASLADTRSSACGAEELIRRADIALVPARRDRSTRVFDASMQAEIMRQVHMADLVNQILDSGVVGLGYQPVVRLSDQATVGAEALLRATDGGEPVSPLALVEAAERSGRMHELGELILRTACADAVSWPRASSGRPVSLSVNLSARQLDDPALSERVLAALDESGLPPASLCLEVTEGALMADPARAAAQLGGLRAHGIRFAADDFGTGYSSLAYLKALPLDALKIDQSFVAGLPDNLEDVAITQAVMAMSDALGLSVTAEGVENERQLGALLELGTGFGQGFLWGKAMPSAQFAERIEAEARDAVPANLVVAPAPWRIPQSAVLGSSEERIDSILNIIAHEIRTPLTVVVGYAHVLEETDDSAKADAASAIGRAAMRIDRILANIVGLSSEGAGLGSGEREIIDAASAVQDILDDQVPRTASLVPPAFGDPRSASIDVDLGQFGQVVTNLISNAVKYSPVGSPVSVSVTVAGGWVDVSVTDRGPGIAADDLGLIFRKYGRTDPLGNGTGLGLYLARQIARSYGGDILYRRAETVGSTFVLRLPRSERRVAEVASGPSGRRDVDQPGTGG